MRPSKRWTARALPPHQFVVDFQPKGEQQKGKTMSTHGWRTIRKRIFAMSLGGLLLIPVPAWAAYPGGRLLAKDDPSGATCSSGAISATADGQPSQDRKLGTAITWMPTPDAASRAAADEGKLVFMIQVSGNFARQEFT